jgi:PAS domain S-box-containing protein
MAAPFTSQMSLHRPTHRTTVGLIITLLLVALVSLIRQLAYPFWDPSISFILFYPVVLVATWLGGFPLGAFATGLLILTLTVFLHYHIAIDLTKSVATLVAMTLEGLGISYLFHALRQRALYAQEQSLQHMRVFINDAPAPIAMFDTQMRYIAVSRRWYTDYKIKAPSVIGRSHYEIFPEIPERWRDVHRRCLAGAIERADEDLFTRADGSEHWLRWEVHPWMLCEKPPTVGGIIMFSEDITSLKIAHEHALRAKAQSEIDAALRIEAERLNKAKDEFLATVSHELRSPLHAMLGWVQLLKKAFNDPARLAQAVAAIERSAQTQTQLISDILDINRITSGKLRLTLQDISLTQLINEAVDAISPQTTAKGISLEKEIPAAEAIIRGDLTRLHQCLGNILSNAVKFTQNEGRIHITATKRDHIIEISVSDTGQGIRADALPLLFERYAQITAASARVHGGLGLGLAITKHLIGLHGGSISAYSAGEGLGSTFTITLPVPALGSQPIGLTVAASAATTPDRFQGLSFLVVDDDLEMRKLLRCLLEDHGAQVHTASSVDEALSILRSARIDLILSDIEMPNKDGYALLQAVRTRGNSVPAIAVTGHSRPEDVAHAFEAGFNQHLTKPVEAQKLLESVDEALRSKPLPRVGNF